MVAQRGATGSRRAEEASNESFLELERQAAAASGQQQRSSSAIARARDDEEARVREAMAALDALERSQSFGGSFAGAAAAQSPALVVGGEVSYPHSILTQSSPYPHLILTLSCRRTRRRSVSCS